MIIDCSFIRQYSKLVARLKDQNQPIFDSILLDFQNQCAMFGSQKGFGQIKMPVENLDPNVKPFFVNSVAFLAVVDSFPTLELDGYAFKSGEGNSFEVAHIEDDSFSYPDFIQTSDDTPFKLSKAMLSAIKRAGSFTDAEASASLNGVFILKGYLFGTNKVRFYQEYIDDLKDTTIAFPRAVWETLVLDVLEGDVTIKKNESQFFLSSGDAISLQFSLSNELTGPDVTSDKFKASYEHEEKITLDRSAFLELLSFFMPFVANSDNNRIQLVYHEDHLEIKTEDGNKISRRMPVVYSDFEKFRDKHIWVSCVWMRSIVSLLPEGDKVAFKTNDKAAVCIRAEGNDNVTCIYSRLKEAV